MKTAAILAICLGVGLLAGPALAKPLPDLKLTKISNPQATASPGNQVPISDKVKNAGKATAQKSTVRFYLSTDTSRGSGDIRMIGDESIIKLKAGVVAKASGSFAIPLETPDGSYFVIGCADDTHVVHESNENNNCRSSKTSVAVNG
jgi:subtilase family serine protease